MSPAPKPAAAERGGDAAVTSEPGRSVALVSVVGWLVPGAAHAWQGRIGKAAIFFFVLSAMFAVGLGCGGRLFPIRGGDPLVLLAGLAEWALGAPRLMAAFVGWGAGDVIAAAYEYGNTFLIAAGLLNALVVLDAVDLATGRKR